jgi:16S rRNA processing protein RimM
MDESADRPVILGKVGAPFGVEGWVKIQSYADPPEGIVGYRPWHLVRGSERRQATALDWKRAGHFIAVQLEGVDSREAAQALTGYEVHVERAALPPVAAGQYYLHDLEGLEASNADGFRLGRVDGILELPAHPVLVIKGGRERLVPLVRERILAVDLDAGRITLDWHPDD